VPDVNGLVAGEARQLLALSRRGLLLAVGGRERAPAWSRWRPTLWVAVFWAGIAVLILAGFNAVAVAITLALHGGSAHVGPWDSPLSLAGIGVLLVGARRPLTGWRIAVALAIVVPLLPGGFADVSPRIGLPIVVLFAVAGWVNGRDAIWGMWLIQLVPLWLWMRHGGPGRPLLISSILALLALAVDAFTARRRTERALTAQTEQTELEIARRTGMEERNRIARELHDVVAHHMSLIAVQAETAPYRIGDLPDPVHAEFSALSAAARDALNDMRRLLGVLRGQEPAARAPTPQYDEIPQLVATARHAGLPVSLSMPVEDTQVPIPVGVCTYRIIQEALANASRHSPGADVAIRIHREQGRLALEICNGPPAERPAPSSEQDGAGHGLTGMRERAAMLGGVLHAGPCSDGGFTVSVSLPLLVEAC
jgi:signal transduction histidine kinase